MGIVSILYSSQSSLDRSAVESDKIRIIVSTFGCTQNNNFDYTVKNEITTFFI